MNRTLDVNVCTRCGNKEFKVLEAKASETQYVAYGKCEWCGNMQMLKYLQRIGS